MSVVRRESVYFLSFLAIIAILLYNDAFVNPVNFEGYWISTFANASIFLIFSCPVSSASAAIATSRLRRADVWALPTVRSRAAIALRMLLPSFLAGIFVQIVGLLVLVPKTWGAPGRIPFEILLVWVAILLLHVAIGCLFGMLLPVAASIPLAIFISYCWLGFTWALDYFPIRYLSGLIIAACCSVDTTLDERSVIAVVLFSLLMSVSLLGFTIASGSGTWNKGLLAGVVAGVLAIGAFVVGLNVAQGLPAQPVAKRSTSDLICAGEEPRICAFPEQLERQDPRPVLETAYKNLRDEGIPLPSVITASNTEADRASLRVVITTRPSAEQLVYSIAAGLLPDDLAPYCDDGSDYLERLEVAAVARWWLQSVAAKDLVDAPSFVSVGADAELAYTGFDRLTRREQHDWYLSASPALWQCSSKPVRIPSR